MLLLILSVLSTASAVLWPDAGPPRMPVAFRTNTGSEVLFDVLPTGFRVISQVCGGPCLEYVFCEGGEPTRALGDSSGIQYEYCRVPGWTMRLAEPGGGMIKYSLHGENTGGHVFEFRILLRRNDLSVRMAKDSGLDFTLDGVRVFHDTPPVLVTSAGTQRLKFEISEEGRGVVVCVVRIPKVDGSFVLDPTFSTYLGGSYFSSAASVVPLEDGILVGGRNDYGEFPNTTIIGNPEGKFTFVSKVSKDGSELLWSTIIGTSGSDYLYALEIDSDLYPVFLGATTRWDEYPSAIIPCNNAVVAFVARLEKDGSSVLSVTPIVPEGTDNTFSPVPATFTLLSKDRAVVLISYSGYFGSYAHCNVSVGPESDAIAVFDFDIASGAIEGEPVCMGGSQNETIAGNNLVANGSEIVLTAQAYDRDFHLFNSDTPPHSGFHGKSDCVVIRVDLDTETVDYWFVGGSGNDRCDSIDADGDSIYIGGATQSNSGDFPITKDAYMSSLYFEESGFIMQCQIDEATGDLDILYSSFVHSENPLDREKSMNTIEYLKVLKEGYVMVCGRGPLDQIVDILDYDFVADGNEWDFCIVFRDRREILTTFKMSFFFKPFCHIATWGTDEIAVVGTARDIKTTGNVIFPGKEDQTINGYLVNIEKCPKGQYGPSWDSCRKCWYGSYNPEYGQDSCLLCPKGTKGVSLGCISEDQCCQKCSPGTYTNQEGAIQCLLCQLGRYQNEEGQTECIPCPPGSYSNTLGSEICTLCGAGQYQPEEGQTGCEVCQNGTVSAAGSSGCHECMYLTRASEDQSQCDIDPFLFLATFGVSSALFFGIAFSLRRAVKKRRSSSTVIRFLDSEDLHLLEGQ